MCRASELSRVRSKALESSDLIQAVCLKKEVKQKQRVQKIQCKYCGFKHEPNMSVRLLEKSVPHGKS